MLFCLFVSYCQITSEKYDVHQIIDMTQKGDKENKFQELNFIQQII